MTAATNPMSSEQKIFAWMESGTRPTFIDANAFFKDAARLIADLVHGWQVGWIEKMCDRFAPHRALAVRRDIDAAWKRYTRWQMSQRGRVSDVAMTQARRRRDDVIAASLFGMFMGVFQ